MATTATPDTLIGIRELASRINRQPATIRMWEREGYLPDELTPTRDTRGWRYWTEEQVNGIKKWMVDADMRPGKGLPHYKRDEAKLNEHLENMRGPRTPAEDENN